MRIAHSLAPSEGREGMQIGLRLRFGARGRGERGKEGSIAEPGRRSTPKHTHQVSHRASELRSRDGRLKG